MLWVAFPLGGMLGAFFNAYLLRFYDWHAIFLLGGALPILLAIVLAFWLPESARFPIGRSIESPALDRIAQNPTGSDAPTRLVVDETTSAGAPIKQLFQREASERRTAVVRLVLHGVRHARGNCVMDARVAHASGVSPADTAIVIGFNGLGTLVGLGIVGRMIERFSAAMTLLPSLLIGAPATAAMGYVSTSVVGASMVMTAIGLFGAIGASGSIFLAVIAYPATLRSTGVGWSMSMGRLGQVIAPIATGAICQSGCRRARRCSRSPRFRLRQRYLWWR